jgi:hypothetical protein
MKGQKENSRTVKIINEPPRGPVTRETVKQLKSEPYLRGVAEIARKYVK